MGMAVGTSPHAPVRDPDRRTHRRWLYGGVAQAFRLVSCGRYQPKWVRLGCHPLLAGYPAKVVHRVANVADEVNVAAGDVLAKQGCPAEWFVLIKSGQAGVFRDGTRLG